MKVSEHTTCPLSFVTVDVLTQSLVHEVFNVLLPFELHLAEGLTYREYSTTYLVYS